MCRCSKYSSTTHTMCLTLLWFLVVCFTHSSSVESLSQYLPTNFPGSNSPTNLCPEISPCVCFDSTIRCSCENDKHLILTSFSKVSMNKLEVRNCKAVQVNTGAFRNLKLEHLEFSNIGNLYIRPFSLSGADLIMNLTLSDIESLDVGIFGLSGLYNVALIMMKNVTGHNLAEFAISGGDIHQVVIKNCTLPLQSFGYIMWNVTSFSVTDTHFKNLRNSSFILRNIEDFSILNSRFSSPASESFALLWMEFVQIINCTFDVLPMELMHCSTEHFIFRNNVVDYSEYDAFLSLYVSDSAEFSHNQFLTIEEDSLFPNPHNNLSATIESAMDLRGNEIFCDCRLAWIFNNTKAYSKLIQTSTCLNHKKTKLLEMLRFFTNEDCNFDGFSKKFPLLEDDDTPYLGNSQSDKLSSHSLQFRMSIYFLCSMVVIELLYTMINL